MKEFVAGVRQYIEKCDWTDLTLFKICVFALGVIVGLCVPKAKKKFPLLLAGLVFIITLVPLADRFIQSGVYKKSK